MASERTLTYEQTACELMELVAENKTLDSAGIANMVASAQVFATLALVSNTRVLADEVRRKGF